MTMVAYIRKSKKIGDKRSRQLFNRQPEAGSVVTGKALTHPGTPSSC